MKKHITEELPERQHRQADAEKAGPESKEGGGKDSSEKKIRQAVYDIRYRARREEVDIRQAFSQYMQNSSLGQQERTAVKAKLFGKKQMSEAYNTNVDAIVVSSIGNALNKVFSEKKEVVDDIDIGEAYAKILNKTEDRKYKVRVTDKNSGKSYVRYATREKISQLRANPYLEVEMTEYGEPYEGEKKKGELTARAAAGRGIAKKDYDGDGKVESGSKEHAGAVHNAIQRKKGGVPDGRDTRRESVEFIDEIKTENKSKSDKIDVMPKKQSNTIKLFPSDSSTSRSPSSLVRSHYEVDGKVISEREMTTSEKTKETKLKSKYDSSGMKSSMTNQYGPEKGKQVYFATIRKQAMGEESCKTEVGVTDSREIPTKINLIKNKMRSMGIKNPIAMVATEEAGDGYIGPARLGIKNPMASDATRAASDKKRQSAAVAGKKPTEGGLLGRMQQRADAVDAYQKMYNHYEPSGPTISEREFDEPGEEDWRPDVRAHNKAVGYRGGYKPYKRRPNPGTSGPGSQAKPAD
jgi:hypothetical protein